MNAERLLAHYEEVADAPDAIARLRRFILDLDVRGKLVAQNPTDEAASELLKRIAKEKARLVKTREIADKPALPVGSEDEVPFGVPEGWRWVRFCNIVEFSAGRTPSRHNPSFWNTGDHPWVSIADMEDGQVLSVTEETVSDRARQRIFRSEPEPPGTIIMSFKLTIGKIARVGISAFHNEAIISIRPHLADLDPYLFKVLPEFARRGDTKGAIKGATLNRDSISNILLPLPPLAEQHCIARRRSKRSSPSRSGRFASTMRCWNGCATRCMPAMPTNVASTRKRLSAIWLNTSDFRTELTPCMSTSWTGWWIRPSSSECRTSGARSRTAASGR